MPSYLWKNDEATCLRNGDEREKGLKKDGKGSIVLQTEIEGGDFGHAGQGSSQLKETMKKLGIDSQLIKRSAISAYEAEMNVVIHSRQGKMEAIISSDKVIVSIQDQGSGIEDIEQALRPGYSTASEEVREMGFGAGLGLSNMKRNADRLFIESEIGEGTEVEITICLDGSR